MKTRAFKTIFLLSINLCFGLYADAQIETEKYRDKQIINYSDELGIHAGGVTGLGISYRHWQGKFGLQVTGIPFKINNNYEEIFFVSAALTGLYSFKNTRHIRLYGYWGNHLQFLQTTTRNTQEEVSDSEYKYNVGIGAGFEAGKKVRFSIMLGYAGYNVLKQNYRLLPTIEMGLYFKLNGRN